MSLIPLDIVSQMVEEIKSNLSKLAGTADSTPPSGGVVLLGYDGTYLRRVKVTSDGKILAYLG